MYKEQWVFQTPSLSSRLFISKRVSKRIVLNILALSQRRCSRNPLLIIVRNSDIIPSRRPSVLLMNLIICRLIVAEIRQGRSTLMLILVAIVIVREGLERGFHRLRKLARGASWPAFERSESEVFKIRMDVGFGIL